TVALYFSMISFIFGGADCSNRVAVAPNRNGKIAKPNMIEIIEKYKATVCFTAPTAYRVMLRAMEEGADLSSLRAAVSAGETLPKPVYDDWMAQTGKPMLDGIGATEMLHIFITNRFDDHQPGCTGKPVNGYEAKVLREDGTEAPAGEIGRLAVRGPTGCRYLKDDRQLGYVSDGWNITGDSFTMDADGYFHFAARNDDMIVSAGYNIAGPEVEAALLSHADVAECAVIGAPDTERGHIVQAHIVLADGAEANDAMAEALQTHVKSVIAPYKYPRSIRFCDGLPKTPTGKVQRFKLKAMEASAK
ncbi:MAG: AMP-binding protein, partial [Pseudomonadota bacterium]